MKKLSELKSSYLSNGMTFKKCTQSSSDTKMVFETTGPEEVYDGIKCPADSTMDATVNMMKIFRDLGYNINWYPVKKGTVSVHVTEKK